MIKRLIFRALTLSLLILAVRDASGQDVESPNILIIFTDDQGFEDIGCFGSPKIKTPHLDKLAAEGRKFTSFYSANSVCSPSRASLLTGCYPVRVSIPGVLFPRHEIGLNPDAVSYTHLTLPTSDLV